jgi:hypothetical protein
LEQAGDKGSLSLHVAATDPPNLSLSDHRHSLVASQCSSCGLEAAEAKAWSGEAFNAPVILLHDVVQELALA